MIYEVGSSDRLVAEAKRVLRKKYSYAKHLDDSQYFSAELRDTLIQWRDRWNVKGTFIPENEKGKLGPATFAALRIPINHGTLYTVLGTAVPDPFGPGPTTDLAHMTKDILSWQPIGNYPAQICPMQPSINCGIDELCVQFNKRSDNAYISGYSQGAVVVCQWLVDEVWNPQGRCHQRRNAVKGIVLFGNPWREKGVANGNQWVNSKPGNPWGTIKMPKGRGISDRRLVETKPWIMDMAHVGDIYTDVPDNGAGEKATAFYKFILRPLTSLFEEGGVPDILFQIMRQPVKEGLESFEMAIRGLIFAGQGTGPHINYRAEPMADWLNHRVLEVANGA